MNDDELCCARAIIVAKAKADEDEQLKTHQRFSTPITEKIGANPT